MRPQDTRPAAGDTGTGLLSRRPLQAIPWASGEDGTRDPSSARNHGPSTCSVALMEFLASKQQPPGPGWAETQAPPRLPASAGSFSCLLRRLRPAWAQSCRARRWGTAFPAGVRLLLPSKQVSLWNGTCDLGWPWSSKPPCQGPTQPGGRAGTNAQDKCQQPRALSTPAC